MGARVPIRVPVLMYHALDDRRSPISTPPATFAWQMRWLDERGYAVIPLSRLIRSLRAADSLPAPSVAITFDDGFASVYTSAFPILARYEFPATVFVVSEYCGRSNDWPGQPAGIPRRPLLSWAQIREMDRHGVECGGHSATHARLDRLAPAGLEREIAGSKASIEEQLGHAVDLFAYPYGRYDAAAKRLASRTYTGACGTQLRLASPESDPFALERIDAYYLQRPAVFRRLTSPPLAAYLGLRRGLRAATSAVLRRPWN